jgi:3-oxoacid CoA-transferase subunit A/3-oxoadipate CoA-transferase alpha subunit
MTGIDASKLCGALEGVAPIRSGAVVMVGGFGLAGTPLTLIDALVERDDLRDLTIISNNLGEPGRGLGRLLREGRVRRAIGSYFTGNPEVARWHSRGALEVELLPQGTLAEAIRAGGAGVAAFYVKTAVGTDLGADREERVFDGERYLLQTALHADVALIRAELADALGNLTYSKTARNFNPDMATAADLVIAEVRDVVPTGALPPESVVTPHLFVDRIVLTAGR